MGATKTGWGKLVAAGFIVGVDIVAGSARHAVVAWRCSWRGRKKACARRRALGNVWHWRLGERKPRTRAEQAVPPFSQGVGVHADFSHLNERRPRARMGKTCWDVRMPRKGGNGEERGFQRVRPQLLRDIAQAEITKK